MFPDTTVSREMLAHVALESELCEEEAVDVFDVGFEMETS